MIFDRLMKENVPPQAGKCERELHFNPATEKIYSHTIGLLTLTGAV